MPESSEDKENLLNKKKQGVISIHQHFLKDTVLSSTLQVLEAEMHF